MITLSPLASFLTVIRFSKEATSWVAASVHKMKSTRMHGILRTFIKPPTDERAKKIRNYAEGREVVNEQYAGARETRYYVPGLYPYHQADRAVEHLLMHHHAGSLY